jgi:hypothetical protein
MAKTFRSVESSQIAPVDCACVIHGNLYDWIYVERLYNMLTRNITGPIRFHVYTEEHRAVPSHMIKHVLQDMGIAGPKLGWWYKMQLFNTQHHQGPLLYFDLDTVIVKNIDWIRHLAPGFFWTVKDFKYLWRPTFQGINSSVMWWDTRDYSQLWQDFSSKRIKEITRQFHGDQDYLTQCIDNKKIRFLPQERVQSWRWECLNGGFNFKNRIYQNPDSGTIAHTDASVLVFHGKPKPHQCTDPYILTHWK